MHRRHAAIGGRDDVALGHEFRDGVDYLDDVAKFVPRSNIVATTNCGMAPMRREVAEAKLMALGAGARLARQRAG